VAFHLAVQRVGQINKHESSKVT